MVASILQRKIKTELSLFHEIIKKRSSYLKTLGPHQPKIKKILVLAIILWIVHLALINFFHQSHIHRNDEMIFLVSADLKTRFEINQRMNLFGEKSGQNYTVNLLNKVSDFGDVKYLVEIVNPSKKFNLNLFLKEKHWLLLPNSKFTLSTKKLKKEGYEILY